MSSLSLDLSPGLQCRLFRDKIGIRGVGKVISRDKMAKHYILDIDETTFRLHPRSGPDHY